MKKKLAKNVKQNPSRFFVYLRNNKKSNIQYLACEKLMDKPLLALRRLLIYWWSRLLPFLPGRKL